MAKRRSSKPGTLPELSRLELAIMDTVWELGDCTSSEVINAFTKKRPLAPSTIRTVLTNLRKKGYLEPIPTIEPGYRLRPTVTRDSVAGHWTDYLVRTLFGESPRRAVACLLKNEKVDDAELDEIHRLIQARKRERKKR